MKANIVPNAFNLVNAISSEGITCLVVDCKDFDHFVTLPAALSYQGHVCGKTGWNSDKNAAYYQSNAKVAYIL